MFVNTFYRLIICTSYKEDIGRDLLIHFTAHSLNEYVLYYIVPKRFTTTATQPDMNDKNYNFFFIECVVGCQVVII